MYATTEAGLIAVSIAVSLLVKESLRPDAELYYGFYSIEGGPWFHHSWVIQSSPKTGHDDTHFDITPATITARMYFGMPHSVQLQECLGLVFTAQGTILRRISFPPNVPLTA